MSGNNQIVPHKKEKYQGVCFVDRSKRRREEKKSFLRLPAKTSLPQHRTNEIVHQRTQIKPKT